MVFNTCETCGASDGRAGILFGGENLPDECANCHDTRKSRSVVIYANLKRTDDEIKRTMEILNLLAPLFPLEQLLEDYKKRLETINKIVKEKPFDFDFDSERKVRLTTKSSCYRQFITELEKTIKE